MEEQNPLLVDFAVKSTTAKISNKSGRPTMKNMIVFSQQPKSIVAQMLTEMKAKNIDSDDKEEIICLDDQTDDSLEVEKLEEHICSVCTFKTNNSEEYNEHLTKHKQYSCDFPNCKYTCKLSSNLIKHKRVHANDKPYLCEKCSFRSNFVNSLKVHKRTHTAERPYQCEHCNYKCNSSSNLKKHCRHRHLETPKDQSDPIS